MGIVGTSIQEPRSEESPSLAMSMGTLLRHLWALDTGTVAILFSCWEYRYGRWECVTSGAALIDERQRVRAETVEAPDRPGILDSYRSKLTSRPVPSHSERWRACPVNIEVDRDPSRACKVVERPVTARHLRHDKWRVRRKSCAWIVGDSAAARDEWKRHRPLKERPPWTARENRRADVGRTARRQT